MSGDSKYVVAVQTDGIGIGSSVRDMQTATTCRCKIEIYFGVR
jgi:hypothetical protein